ncbi:MAG: TIGR04283 family arsenosugar biosynthesis glycosyltransferase [Micropepsaceae bacterium]
MNNVFAVATEPGAEQLKNRPAEAVHGSSPRDVHKSPDLSIVIPTLNASKFLGDTFYALQEAAETMSVEFIVADGGSHDDTVEKAKSLGARVISTTRGRGTQLAAGAKDARGRWLLFLHADTTLEPFWSTTVTSFIRNKSNTLKAAHFTFALDDASNAARRVEVLTNWRARRFGLPYGDQGLLMSRQLYSALVGYLDIPIMEDVDIVRRIGKNNLRELPATATTSSRRYKRDGYWMRPLRNLSLLLLYFLGVSPHRLAPLYG